MFRIIKENFMFRAQISRLARSELIKTYKGAALGPLWGIIRPSIMIFVYWFAFEIGLRVGRDVGGHPFFVFLIVGICPWFFIRESIVSGSGCIRKNRNLVTKMPFPISTIMTYTMLSKLIINLGLTVIVYVILLFSGYNPSIYNLQILYYMPLMFIFFTCLSWITAPLSCISKDFQNLVKSLIVAVFWLSGIMWNPYLLENEVLKKIILANPVNYIVNGYRNTFINEKWFFETTYETVVFLAWLVIISLVGSFTFNKLRKRILDVL